MFYNNAVCDIYIGKGAGAKMMQDIRNAKRNVKIVSPYLSPFLIKELIYLHSKGIKIRLITTDEIEDFYGHDKNIHKLIIQNQHTDENAKRTRDNLVSLSRIFLFATIGLGVVLLLLMYFLNNFKIFYGFPAVVFIFIVRDSIVKKIKKTKIYYYTYKQLFPFKVFISANRQNSYDRTFIHSKIYIIDDEIAYLGSLNFTGSGVKGNHETRIRTSDPKAVSEIIAEVKEMFYHSGLPERDIQFWGSQLYDGPIN